MRRQNAVVLYGLAGSDRDSVGGDELDAIVRTLQRFLHVEYAGVHILDGDEIVPLAAGDHTPAPPIPRGEALCGTALDHFGDATIVEVADATHEPLFQRLRDVEGSPDPVRFYAAAPLRPVAGPALGTLCVIGREPRVLDDDERGLLLHLGYAVVQVLERHRRQLRSPLPDTPQATST